MRYSGSARLPPLSEIADGDAACRDWDDHDYGPNDADMSYVMKGESLAALPPLLGQSELRACPTCPASSAARAGATSTSSFWTIAGTAPPTARCDGPGKTMFGAQQLAWLQQRAHLLAGDDQARRQRQPDVEPSEPLRGLESLRHRAACVRGMAAAQKIDGVMFLSGDRHFSELLKIDRPGAYPLYEYTSSPLTSRAWSQSRRRRKSRIPTSCRARCSVGGSSA